MVADIGAAGASSRSAYSGTMIAVHWFTLLLALLLFAAIWSVDFFPAPLRPIVIRVHQSAGLTIFLLVIARLIARAVTGVPPLPATVGRLQHLAARAMEFTLYGLMLAQPLLGWTMTNARGRDVSYLGFIPLPTVLAKDQALGHTLVNLHHFCGYAILVLVAVHAAAALYHHYAQRDTVLDSMLPESMRRT